MFLSLGQACFFVCLFVSVSTPDLFVSLGQAGAPVEKLLHYGPVIQGIAYLSRRLNENRSGMPAADVERQLMWREMKKRLRGGLPRNGTSKQTPAS